MTPSDARAGKRLVGLFFGRTAGLQAPVRIVMLAFVACAIAAEELFVNVCHYAYPDATPDDPGEVRIGFQYEANPPSLTVRITDRGIPYDPLAKADSVTPDDIADVPIGGLGILMAKNSVDDMTYERKDDRNIVTFVKRW